MAWHDNMMQTHTHGQISRSQAHHQPAHAWMPMHGHGHATSHEAQATQCNGVGMHACMAKGERLHGCTPDGVDGALAAPPPPGSTCCSSPAAPA